MLISNFATICFVSFSALHCEEMSSHYSWNEMIIYLAYKLHNILFSSNLLSRHKERDVISLCNIPFSLKHGSLKLEG